MMANLDRCPFCGRRAKIWGGNSYTIIQCMNDKCSAYISVQGENTQQEAIMRWNRRVVR